MSPATVLIVDDEPLVRRALLRRLDREGYELREAQSGTEALKEFSPAMQQVRGPLARVAASPASTVLLTGETGTGKDLAAKAIHHNSARAGRSLVNITCSALPEQLLESELFGHERSAFTDARQQKRGLFEIADGGTVFLDEIARVPRALSDRERHRHRPPSRRRSSQRPPSATRFDSEVGR